MTRTGAAWATMVAILTVLGHWGVSIGSKNGETQGGIPPEAVADYVHAVIEAERTFYTIHVVERLQGKGILVASENWLSTNTLPLPAQFLMESAKLATMTRAGVGYRLISGWPINAQNRPNTEFERTGFGDVVAKPDSAYTGIVTDGQDRYFEAIYADKAVSQACIGCHNAHPSSPRRDFKLNDVMGAIVITIPLSR